MARFNWKTFCDRYRIDYVERGPNINTHQIGIKCPMCGNADPSEHMALSLKDGWWHCRRNTAHNGTTPHYLVRLLLSCTQDEAARIVGDQGPERAKDASFLEQMRKMMRLETRAETTEASGRPVDMPREFRQLSPRGMGNRFWQYMLGRHYTDAQLYELSRVYDLRYATTGLYRDRVIIPVYTAAGLESWTGRTITQRDMVRYRSLSPNDWKAPDVSPPITNIHDLLLNEHDLEKGGEVLVVVEGPFDAMRVDFFGWPLSIRGTCFFGKSVQPRQATKLINLSKHYRRKWVLLDEDAKLDSLAVQTELQRGGFRVRYMTGGKDAAALDETEIKQLLSEL